MKNYNEVKNYIHNELNITKEDIKKLVEKEVINQVSILMNDSDYIHTLIKNHIIQLVNDKNYNNPRYRTITDINAFIYDGLIEELGKTVHDNIKIKVGLKSDNLEIEEIKGEK